MQKNIYRAVVWVFIICSVFLLGVSPLELVTSAYSSIDNRREESQPEEAGTDTLDILATSAILVDGDNGRVLYEKNGYEERAMASTTKIMTLLVVLKYGNLEDVVAVSDYAASMPDVQLNIRKGENYYLKDLVYSLMLESHNDSAVAIAEHIGGSVEGFAELMNRMAYDFGAYHTHFVTPNGLDNEEHYSTAYDLALITRHALDNPQFIEITNTRSHSFSDVAGNRSFTVTNRNAFLNTYEGAIGVKTGFTGNAGYCFVGAVEREGHRLIAVVLACGWPPHKTYKWKDMRTLFDYGFKNYKPQTVYEPQSEAVYVRVEDGIEGDLCCGYTKEEVSLYMREEERADYIWNVPETINAPVSAGDVIGSLDIYINNKFYKKQMIFADRTIHKINFTYVFMKILNRFWCRA